MASGWLIPKSDPSSQNSKSISPLVEHPAPYLYQVGKRPNFFYVGKSVDEEAHNKEAKTKV